MRTSSNILISTTSTLSGAEIAAYLKIVTSHVVAGAGFFSDFAASFTDVFGGRSLSYQKQLTAIENEAIRQLQAKASMMGADAIVGLKLDFDEISGKSKSMLMVSASGTAVKLVNKTIKRSSIPNSIDSDQFDNLVKKNRILELIKDENINLKNKDNWERCIELQIDEAAGVITDFIIDRYKLDEQFASTVDSEEYSNYKRYFSSIDSAVASEYLYKIVENGTTKAWMFAQSCIKERELYSHDDISRLLNHENIIVKKRALKLLDIYKPYYTKEDIAETEALITLISNTFQPLGQKHFKNKLITNKQVEIWRCACGKENDIDDKYCKECSRDIFGFMKDELKPDEAISNLKRKAEVLSEAFIE